MLFSNKPTSRLSQSFNTITVGLLSPEEILDRSYGEILKPVYNSISQLSIDNKIYFLAKREILDASLLINLLVDSKGKIILNQALDLEDAIKISCE